MTNSIGAAKRITSLLKYWPTREVVDGDDLAKKAWPVDDESTSAVSWPDGKVELFKCSGE